MTAKDRYTSIQTVLEECGKYGCLFLCLLSIAEETAETEFDLINVIHHCMSKGWLDEDFFVRDNLAILNYLTKRVWTRRSVGTLPYIGEKDYTVAIYHNSRTGLTHYRRRAYDTLTSSTTVKEGYVQGYYIYSWRWS